MKKSFRFIVAPLLLAIYLLITMSPLAPMALKSPRLAHAITGECSGDCDICGCSPERRANHTCCCCLKKKHQHDHDEENVPDCCRKKHRGGKPALTCNCPCGSNKQLGLWGSEKLEQLPYHFTEGKPVFQESSLVSLNPDCLTSRYLDPPDPPPKLALLT
jgi:hypothetical protein